MGVINLTPDSFSDGGKYINPEKALLRSSEFIKQGVDVIDIGAQSTRPGAIDVGPDEEIKRIILPIKLIRSEFPRCLISVDTFHSKVAIKALELGVDWINDVTGGRYDRSILKVSAEAKSPYVLTHSRGNSLTMDKLNKYEYVVTDVINELSISTEIALKNGIDSENIIWDPGIGFAKDDEQNLDLLRNIEKLTCGEFPILVGPSKKRFIGNLLNTKNVDERIWGTNAVICRCVLGNVSIVRVHDVSSAVQTIKMCNAIFK